MRVGNVLGAPQQLSHDPQAVSGRQTLRGTGELTAHPRRRFVSGEDAEALAHVSGDPPGIAEQAHRPGAHVLVPVVERVESEIGVETAADIQRPERFQGELVAALQDILAQHRDHGGVAPFGENAADLARDPGIWVV